MLVSIKNTDLLNGILRYISPADMLEYMVVTSAVKSFASELVGAKVMSGVVNNGFGYDVIYNHHSPIVFDRGEVKWTDYRKGNTTLWSNLSNKEGHCESIILTTSHRERVIVSVIDSLEFYAKAHLYKSEGNKFAINADFSVNSNNKNKNENTKLFLDNVVEYDGRFSDMASMTSYQLLGLMSDHEINSSTNLRAAFGALIGELYVCKLVNGTMVYNGIGYDLIAGKNPYCPEGSKVEVKSCFIILKGTLRVRSIKSKIDIAEYIALVNGCRYGCGGLLEASLIPMMTVLKRDLINTDDSIVWRPNDNISLANNQIDRTQEEYNKGYMGDKNITLVA